MEQNTQNRSAFSEAIKAAVGSSGTVRDLVPMTSVVIRDLDDITTEEDIRTVLAAELGNDHEVQRVSISNNSYRGQRTANVVLREEGLAKLLDVGRIRIGWVNFRIRLALKIVRCFKCLDFGHLARTCKGPDRSKLCLRCGDASHKIKECKERPCCLLCSPLGDSTINTEHDTGSRTCPKFRDHRTKLSSSAKRLNVFKQTKIDVGLPTTFFSSLLEFMA